MVEFKNVNHELTMVEVEKIYEHNIVVCSRRNYLPGFW